MFLGHFGVGFGTKAAVPHVSLGTLFLAAQFADLLWPTLLMLGVEQVRIINDPVQGPPLEFVHYPISHSLVGVLVWAGLFAVIYYVVRRSQTGAWAVGALVFSHWLLDLIVHYPDLPLYPGSAVRLGFALWSHPTAELLLELVIFAVGVVLYLRVTDARDAIGIWALWSLITFLFLIQIANTFGSPPPSVDVLAWVGQAQWLLVIWAYWVDHHRQSHSRPRAKS
jgi:LexA-binding, inner membrane-associated putative hydrolase